MKLILSTNQNKQTQSMKPTH